MQRVLIFITALSISLAVQALQQLYRDDEIKDRSCPRHGIIAEGIPVDKSYKLARKWIVD